MRFTLVLWMWSAWLGLAESGYVYERSLGSDCLYDEDCLTRNSFCKGNKVCTCKIGYQYDAGSDVCFPREINLKCNEDYDCSSLQNAKCLGGICKCRNDYVPAKDKASCLPSMRLTSFCEEDSQCNSVMNKSYCEPVMRQCVCERGYRRDSFRMLCVEKPKLHSPCITTEDCEWSDELQGRVECINVGRVTRTCECRLNYYEDRDFCYSGGPSRTALSAASLLAILIVKLIQ